VEDEEKEKEVDGKRRRRVLRCLFLDRDSCHWMPVGRRELCSFTSSACAEPDFELVVLRSRKITAKHTARDVGVDGQIEVSKSKELTNVVVRAISSSASGSLTSASSRGDAGARGGNALDCTFLFMLLCIQWTDRC
jgi:hypothetical protein